MNYYDKTAEKGIYYGNLPHMRQNTVCYFVTFRTADSIPQTKLKQWLQERDEWLLDHPEPLSDADRNEYNRRFSRKIEHWLDSNYGECQLAIGKCKEIVTNALLFFHGKRYLLWEYAVAANHVHLLIEPLFDFQLEDIMHSIKSYTAKEVNKIIGKTGHFWQKEYFDHIVRSQEHYDKFVTYITNHNVEASSRSLNNNQLQDDVATVEASSRSLVNNHRQDDVATVEALSRSLVNNHRQDDVATTTKVKR